LKKVEVDDCSKELNGLFWTLQQYFWTLHTNVVLHYVFVILILIFIYPAVSAGSDDLKS